MDDLGFLDIEAPLLTFRSPLKLSTASAANVAAGALGPPCAASTTPLRRSSDDTRHAAATPTTGPTRQPPSSTGLHRRPPPAAVVSAESFLRVPVAEDVRARLHAHQLEALEWLFHQHKTSGGCLLADEMGLGKTVTVSAYLGALLHAGICKTVVVVLPGSLIDVWRKCLVDWALLPPAAITVVHAERKAVRDQVWARLSHGMQVVALTTYGVLKRDIATIRRTTVDYVVLDEAHTIKDASTDVAKAAVQLACRHRIAITGTPLMNSFHDLWGLFEFIDASLLGNFDAASVNDAILRTQQRDAPLQERQSGAAQLAALRAAVDPHVLRRDKRSLGLSVVSSRKREWTVWVEMSDVQREQYLGFLDLDETRRLLGGGGGEARKRNRQPLALLNTLRNIANHPWLNFTEANFRRAMVSPLDSLPPPFADFGTIVDSAKVRAAAEILARCKASGEKAVVFSRSKRLLDMVGFVAVRRAVRTIRLDGATAPSQRSAVVQQFSSSPDITACLMTAQVGGVGLTFNCATTAVLLDPSWNPAVDAQAADRLHRIGQTRDVAVFRLVTCGTVEEKIYRNQIVKTNAARHAVSSNAIRDNGTPSLGSAAPCALFTRVQLKSMFELGDVGRSETAEQLKAAFGVRSEDGDAPAWIMSIPGVVTCSDHGATTNSEPTLEPEEEQPLQSVHPAGQGPSLAAAAAADVLPPRRFAEDGSAKRRRGPRRLRPLAAPLSLSELAEQYVDLFDNADDGAGSAAKTRTLPSADSLLRAEDNKANAVEKKANCHTAEDQAEAVDASWPAATTTTTIEAEADDEGGSFLAGIVAPRGRPRCSILLQGCTLDSLLYEGLLADAQCAGRGALRMDATTSCSAAPLSSFSAPRGSDEWSVEYFLFRGVPIRRLHLDLVFATQGHRDDDPGAAVDEEELDVTGFMSNDDDDDEHDDARSPSRSPAGGAAPDWASFDCDGGGGSCRPSYAVRRNAAMSSLLLRFNSRNTTVAQPPQCEDRDEEDC